MLTNQKSLKVNLLRFHLETGRLLIGNNVFNIRPLWAIKKKKTTYNRNFYGGPLFRNLSSNAEDVGSIPGQETKTPHAVVVQSVSHVRLFVTPWTCSMLGFSVLHCLPEFAQTHVH